MTRALIVAALAILAATSPGAQRGDTMLRVGITRPGGGYTVVTMSIETYVARVLAGEAARDSRPAALDALAITVRTFALANRGRHRADGFDLCDQTHCQVVRTATAATEHAADRTAGRVLLRDGAPASVFYTASCGGRTEIPSAVWPGAPDPDYLPSKKDDACGGAPVWTADLDEADVRRALEGAGFRGSRLRDVKIVARDVSGRASKLRLDGLTPDHMSGQDFRTAVSRALGWQLIKSTAFDVKRESSHFTFSGHGSGHGVGMCVIGSAHLAVEGQSAEEILDHYFPGLEIAAFTPRAASASAAAKAPRAEPAGLMVSLPDEDEGERVAVDTIADRARGELANALNVPVPARITIRFHPTTDAFARATSQPPWSAVAVVNGDVHLTPLSMLRDRGVLDKTIRRGIVHLMIDATLARRPMWVREGAAIYFADTAEDQARAQTQGKAACPSDAELSNPVSVGALSNAYTRARACFARQIASGRSWRDVR